MFPTPRFCSTCRTVQGGDGHPGACCPVLGRGLTAAPGRNSRPVSIHRPPLCERCASLGGFPAHTSAACTQRGLFPLGGTLFPQPVARGAGGTRRRGCGGDGRGLSHPRLAGSPEPPSLLLETFHVHPTALTWTRGKGGGVIWEIGIDICILLYIK